QAGGPQAGEVGGLVAVAVEGRQRFGARGLGQLTGGGPAVQGGEVAAGEEPTEVAGAEHRRPVEEEHVSRTAGRAPGRVARRAPRRAEGCGPPLPGGRGRAGRRTAGRGRARRVRRPPPRRRPGGRTWRWPARAWPGRG